ncbi:SMI1/KNR4 family protein [Rhodopirellula sp. JC740]|uniref:SMI1/KNR4 family protein n=1 Tax=Rhodopirellula halodulae TaxID=2894198 RepID=A0ABS8NLA6_9BACT|nr:SMI1/KNR4 family protein [Rhodopirellula sp. JC740]MCC9644335.1 SMI1/KNR4 family protein [Rhodopirellula sp. JC740]
MAKRKSKSIDIKKIAFRGRGPKLTREKLASLPVWLTDEYQDFLLIHNGGTPVDNAFRYPFSGMENISTIDFFYAVRSRSDRYPYDNLIDHGLLGHRNDLPRWSIPIARVDEDSFILIFEDGPYQDGVWYFIWMHDDPDSDPYVETKDAIAKVSDSIPEFLSTLRPYYSFYSIISYVVPDDVSLAAIRRATKPLGLKWVQYDDDRGKYACCDWDLLRDKSFLDTTIFLVDNGHIPSTHYANLKLPKIKAPRGTQVMHLVMSSAFEDTVLKKFPKRIGDWRLTPVENGT